VTWQSEAQRIKAMMGTLIGHFEDVLTEAGMRDSLCALSIYPGVGVPFDYAVDPDSDGCTGGMGWIRMFSAFPSSTYPAPENTLRGSCTAPAAFMVEIGLVRPAGVLTEDLEGVTVPSPEEEFDLSMALIDDMMAMREAVLRTKATYTDIILGAWSPTGPDGGAVGGTWTITLSADAD
jgi:hypothetical protein